MRGSKGPGSTEICLGGNSRAWCFREPLDGPVAVPGVDDKEIQGPLEQGASCPSIRACLRFRDDNQEHRLTDIEGDFFSARTVRRSDRSPSHVLAGFGEFCSLPFLLLLTHPAILSL